ncbi:CHAT domain-containing protein [Nodosilinea sp. FACHB-131]|uniref:CHAT domain-containing protein n=1 Tax=Cyanophyceae TaxID=3028117 RepID=UPI0016883D35|nr:CHAT domain-containing protein [Nodosilinea sp. FACHB-131]
MFVSFCQRSPQATLCKQKRWPQTAAWGIALAIATLSTLPAHAQTLNEKVLAMEQGLEQDFADHFGDDPMIVTQGPDQIAATLARLGAETGTNPAVLWVIPRGDHLHLVLLTAKGQPIVRDLHDVPDDILRAAVNDFALETSSVVPRRNRPAAQKLHQWIIEPYEAEFLTAEGIDTLLFCLGDGVRGLPLAALHDGEQFLIEKYSLTRIPAFNLIETDYTALRPGNILAMGASEFDTQAPLPAVPTELSSILLELRQARPEGESWQGRSFLNQGFTLPNLRLWLRAQAPTVVHLATHAVFEPGAPSNSYIQLWDRQLSLEDMRQINWNSPALELLVLSACRTAIGDDEAELGFAGLALQSGVKSALASLWNVDDAGTLALMNEFYANLGRTTTKAEALRQAQLAMLRGEARFEGDRLLLSRGAVSVPTDLQTSTGADLSSPYYWAGFSLISSPW